MLWTPDDYNPGDFTIVRVGDEYHLFAESFKVGYVPTPGREGGHRPVIHYVSRDLFHWDELPIAIDCGPPGSFDGFAIFHMDVFVHDGTWYMHYTGLDKRGPGQQQTVALATSPDGIHWTKHPGNPIVRADPRWYEPAIPREATYQEKDFGRLWFRDPCIIRDSRSGKFGMIVVARDASKHPDVRGCLTWSTSDDLVHWENHPPLYSPGRFHTIETPSIFEHEGRHYVIYMTHPLWGVRPRTTDPYVTAGDFYAISESGWEGPYVPPSDEVLIGSHGQIRFGAQRTVLGADGVRYLYGWLSTRPGPTDVQDVKVRPHFLPPLKPIRFLPDGRMHAMYNAAIEKFAKPASASNPPAIGPRWRSSPGGLVGKHLQGRTVQSLGDAPPRLVFSADVEFLRGDRAGLVLRADADATTGWYAVADRRYGRIEFGALDEPAFLDARTWTPSDRVSLKVFVYDFAVEVYADDRLMIAQARFKETAGSIGLIAEYAEARFANLRLLSFQG